MGKYLDSFVKDIASNRDCLYPQVEMEAVEETDKSTDVTGGTGDDKDSEETGFEGEVTNCRACFYSRKI